MTRTTLIPRAVAGVVVAGLLVAVATPWPAAGQRPRPAAAPEGARKAFAGLPEGESRPVDFLAPAAVWAGLTPREKADQLRDWVLFAAVGQSGLTDAEVARATCDLPTARHGFLRPTAQFEYGATRSCYLGGGRVLAVVPTTDDPNERRDHLGHIADEHRKNRGEIPAVVTVVEYAVDARRQRGTVTRRPDVPGKDLFTAEYGYHQHAVTDLAGLEKFVAGVRDVTYAALDGNKGLVLGGRTLLSRKYRSLRVEDIAAVWQAQAKLTKAGGRLDHTGFSLDPVYDYDGLTKWFKDELEPELRKLAKADEAPITADDIDVAALGLELKTANPLLAMLGIVKEKGSKAKKPEWLLAVERWVEKSDGFQFQRARYVGDLQGTEVGMVLFYTDLLAKLWAGIDLNRAAPVREIDDFRTAVDGRNPAFFKAKQQEQPYTRIWFGLDPTGYELLPDRAGVLFARRAARIYSASSDPLKPGVEVATSPASEGVFGWWNDHFEEVARLEPEYERLNEYMKWSLIASWLADRGQSNRLNFLAPVKVDRTAWFPTWARGNTDLRFTRWDKIGFYERGYKGTTTEALPRLRSRPFPDFGDFLSSWTVTGGVSGASPSRDVGGRTPLPAKPDLLPSAGGGGVDWKRSVPGGPVVTHRGVTHTFDAANSAVRIKPDPARPLAARDGEVAARELTRSVTTGPDGVRIDTRVGATDFGSLTVRSAADGLRIGYSPRDFAAALDAARAPPGAPTPGLRGEVVGPNGERFLKLAGAGQWVKVTPERVPSDGLPAGVEARVESGGAFGKGTSHVAWAEPAEVTRAMEQAGWVQLRLTADVDQRTLIRVDARGPPVPPPPGDRPVTIAGPDGPEPIKGNVTAEGRLLFIKVADLPEQYRKNPERLAARFGPAEADTVTTAVRKAADGKDPVEVKLTGTPPTERDAAVRDAVAAVVSRRPADALIALDQAGEPTPVTRLIKAWAELRLGRDEAARVTLGLGPKDPLTPDKLGRFYDEVARRAAAADTPSAEKYALHVMATARTRHLTATVVDGEPKLVDPDPLLRPSAADKPKPEDHVYIGDDGRFANVDWPGAVKAGTLGKTLDANGAELFEVFSSGARQFPSPPVPPDRVTYQDRSGDPGRPFSDRFRTATRVGAGGVALAALAAFALGVDEDEEDEEDLGLPPGLRPRKAPPARKADGKPPPRMYLIVPKAEAKPKPKLPAGKEPGNDR